MGRTRSLAPVCVDTWTLRSDMLLPNFIPHINNQINITQNVPYKLTFLTFLCYYDVCYSENEYQDIPGGKDGRCVRVTTLPPSYAECLDILEP
jgi:hypothetical protein